MELSVFQEARVRFTERRVRLIASKAIPAVKVGGEEIGPLEESETFEARLWVGEKLIAGGYATFASVGEALELPELQVIQFKETIQSARRLSTLPEGFYLKLHRLLRNLKGEEFQKALRLATDVVHSRVGKILSLATAAGEGEILLQNLAPEEKAFYRKISAGVAEWEQEALRYGA